MLLVFFNVGMKFDLTAELVTTGEPFDDICGRILRFLNADFGTTAFIRTSNNLSLAHDLKNRQRIP